MSCFHSHHGLKHSKEGAIFTLDLLSLVSTHCSCQKTENEIKSKETEGSWDKKSARVALKLSVQHIVIPTSQICAFYQVVLFGIRQTGRQAQGLNVPEGKAVSCFRWFKDDISQSAFQTEKGIGHQGLRWGSHMQPFTLGPEAVSHFKHIITFS